MLNFALNIGLCNMIGGRFGSLLGTAEDETGYGRPIFRCAIPAILSALLCHTFLHAALVFLAVAAGSAIWYVFGWSFDEITGRWDKTKYPAIIQWIGRHLLPSDDPASNRARGVIMKGLRGGYDGLTYGLLAIPNPFTALLWLPCFAMGTVYWLAGRLVPESHAVMLAEFLYGLLRGSLLYLAITWGTL